MRRKLEFKDICGYLPYDLHYQCEYLDGHIKVDGYLNYKNLQDLMRNIAFDTPILRPLSDLYKTITHNGKEIVPIVELAEIAGDEKNWILEGDTAFHPGLKLSVNFCKVCGFIFQRLNDSDEIDNLIVNSQVELFDYLNELKIDYRGLIDAGVAIDCNTLNDFQI
jgi:hypothetical protein